LIRISLAASGYQPSGRSDSDIRQQPDGAGSHKPQGTSPSTEIPHISLPNGQAVLRVPVACSSSKASAAVFIPSNFALSRLQIIKNLISHGNDNTHLADYSSCIRAATISLIAHATPPRSMTRDVGSNGHLWPLINVAIMLAICSLRPILANRSRKVPRLASLLSFCQLGSSCSG